MGYVFKTEIALSDNDFLCVDYSDAPSMWTFIQIFKIAFTPARDMGKIRWHLFF